LEAAGEKHPYYPSIVGVVKSMNLLWTGHAVRLENTNITNVTVKACWKANT